MSLSEKDSVEDMDISDLAVASEMEAEETEVILESQEDVIHEEEVHTEIAGEEVEIEMERAESPEEILPDIKSKVSTVPPLRPLTIAPKPAKVPITVKPVGGQQLLLLQGAGQAIKLVSPQGQELNLTNFSLSRPILKPATVKTVNSQGNISIVQPKHVVMKKILSPGQKPIQKPINTFTKQGQQFVVVQKGDQQIKLVQSATVPSPTKTLTLQQAQDMGLITNAKIFPQGTSTPKLVTKGQPKTIKLVPQVSPLVGSLSGTKTITMNQIKTPTKILPATSGISSKGAQRIIFKTAGTNQTILPSGQIIQVAGSSALNSGQLHQINIPGKGMQYIKFVTTSNADTNSSTATTINTVKTSVNASSGNLVLSEIKPISSTANIAPKPIKPLQNQMSVSGTQMVVLGSNYTTVKPQLTKVAISQPQISKVAIPMRHNSSPKTAALAPSDNTSPNSSLEVTADANGIRPRKPCNCTKSRCLKLYCDCFANGEFCYMCNCMNCSNNLENEEQRNRAIKACLERNPNAFRPKIGKAKGDLSIRKHTKGCNCKRSGCLKNYCECYEAKIACSSNCKCAGCRNIEDSLEKKNLRVSSFDNGVNSPATGGKMYPNKDMGHFRFRRDGNKHPLNYVTEEVIEATCQCLLTVSDSAESNMQDDELTIPQILEEFGRCLKEIIDCSESHS